MTFTLFLQIVGIVLGTLAVLGVLWLVWETLTQERWDR